eukprot:gene9987-11046_t
MSDDSCGDPTLGEYSLDAIDQEAPLSSDDVYSLNHSPLYGSGGSKRKADVPMTTMNHGNSSSSCGNLSGMMNNSLEGVMNGQSKKRFIWPTSLHHHFVAAVFDIGLRSATPKELIALLNENGGLSSPVTVDQYRSHLQKLRCFRDPNRLGHQPFYDESSANHTQHSLVRPLSSSSKLDRLSDIDRHSNATTPMATGSRISSHTPSAENLQRELIQSLNEQIIQVGRAINLQTTFLDHLRSSLDKQTHLYAQLLHSIGSDSTSSVDGRSDPFTFSQNSNKSMYGLGPGDGNDGYMSQRPRANSASSNHLLHSSSSRAELSMISEMREQMNLHRQLLMKKESLQVPPGHQHYYNNNNDTGLQPPPSSHGCVVNESKSDESSSSRMLLQSNTSYMGLDHQQTGYGNGQSVDAVLPVLPHDQHICDGGVRGGPSLPLSKIIPPNQSLGLDISAADHQKLWDDDTLFSFLDTEFSASPV